MSEPLEELYQEVILDHSRRPRNFGALENATAIVRGDNPSCGDEIHLAVRLSDGGQLEEVKFTGQGCAISMASASLLTLKTRGKEVDEALHLSRAFQELIAGSQPESAPALGDLRALAGVRKFPARVKCAMLAWRALEEALRTKGASASVTTEAGPVA